MKFFNKLVMAYCLALVVSCNNDDDSHFVIIKVTEIIAPEQKKLNEAKGTVINDFQEYLEKEWIDELKSQYKVKVRKAELKRIKKNNSI